MGQKPKVKNEGMFKIFISHHIILTYCTNARRDVNALTLLLFFLFGTLMTECVLIDLTVQISPTNLGSHFDEK